MEWTTGNTLRGNVTICMCACACVFVIVCSDVYACDNMTTWYSVEHRRAGLQGMSDPLQCLPCLCYSVQGKMLYKALISINAASKDMAPQFANAESKVRAEASTVLVGLKQLS